VEGFFRAVLDVASRLGLRWYERVALILAAALLVYAGREAVEAVRAIEWKVEPSPAPLSDGGIAADREIPPAVLTEGEPGGGETGGMG
jgi:hypothetical protein